MTTISRFLKIGGGCQQLTSMRGRGRSQGVGNEMSYSCIQKSLPPRKTNHLFSILMGLVRTSAVHNTKMLGGIVIRKQRRKCCLSEVHTKSL